MESRSWYNRAWREDKTDGRGLMHSGSPQKACDERSLPYPGLDGVCIILDSAAWAVRCKNACPDTRATESSIGYPIASVHHWSSSQTCILPRENVYYLERKPVKLRATGRNNSA